MAVPVPPALLISVHVVHAIEVHDAVVQVVLVLLHLDVLVVCAVAAVGRTLLAGHDSCTGGSLGGVTSWGEGVGSHCGVVTLGREETGWHFLFLHKFVDLFFFCVFFLLLPSRFCPEKRRGA